MCSNAQEVLNIGKDIVLLDEAPALLKVWSSKSYLGTTTWEHVQRKFMQVPSRSRTGISSSLRLLLHS